MGTAYLLDDHTFVHGANKADVLLKNEKPSGGTSASIIEIAYDTVSRFHARILIAMNDNA